MAAEGGRYHRRACARRSGGERLLLGLAARGEAEADEEVLFSWIEWPDKATRDTAFAKMTEWMNDPEKADPRMAPAKNPMPFDGKRLIFGGFTPIVELKS